MGSAHEKLIDIVVDVESVAVPSHSNADYCGNLDEIDLKDYLDKDLHSNIVHDHMNELDCQG